MSSDNDLKWDESICFVSVLVLALKTSNIGFGEQSTHPECTFPENERFTEVGDIWDIWSISKRVNENS